MPPELAGERADKVGDVALTAMGYSESEKCICCPCMPASQILFFVMVGYVVSFDLFKRDFHSVFCSFFAFNCYRLGAGIEFLSACSDDRNSSAETMELPVTIEDNSTVDLNATEAYEGEGLMWLIKSDNETATYLGE